MAPDLPSCLALPADARPEELLSGSSEDPLALWETPGLRRCALT